ncbi:MAG: hypothetical protein HY820_04685 [Acidobacteria bacterium]|nr:hypothetical protein [Acidobacteriota bacterium]
MTLAAQQLFGIVLVLTLKFDVENGIVIEQQNQIGPLLLHRGEFDVQGRTPGVFFF